MKLYTYYRSQASFRVRIALNLKGVSFSNWASTGSNARRERAPVDPRRGRHHSRDFARSVRNRPAAWHSSPPRGAA